MDIFSYVIYMLKAGSRKIKEGGFLRFQDGSFEEL